MNMKVKNARGRTISVRADVGTELMACGRRLTDELMKHAEVLGVIAGGSCAHSGADSFSDLDLYVFGENKTECERIIHECCRALGGGRPALSE